MHNSHTLLPRPFDTGYGIVVGSNTAVNTHPDKARVIIRQPLNVIDYPLSVCENVKSNLLLIQILYDIPYERL